MEPIQIIKSNPEYLKDFIPEDNNFLEVSEFFCDTIQGENFVGYPAAFLRLQHCTLNCVWCDSQEVWKFGNPYTFGELFQLMDEADLPRKLSEGQHLVITGGSPLKQQMGLVLFIRAFIERYNFKPYIEIENECVLPVGVALAAYVDCWNNSPKLPDSGNSLRACNIPSIIKRTAELENSWFKFVISSDFDWKHIEALFLDTNLIRKSQIVLMPLGETREEVEKNREAVLTIAIRENVRYTSREHVIIWDQKTGV